MEEKTKKEIIWENLKKHKKNKRINLVQLSKDVECSLAYISATMRYALESDFVKFDETGNYVIKDVPDYPTFYEETNKRYAIYRGASGGRSRKKSKAVPKDIKFKVEGENIINVIKALLNENEELNQKLIKLMDYTKKVKSERDELLRGLSEIDM